MTLPPEHPVSYHENFIPKAECDALFDWLSEECSELRHNLIEMAGGGVLTLDYGKTMFVDEEIVDDSVFSLRHGRRIPWPQILLPLRDRIEEFTGLEFSVCVGLYYPSGEVGIGYHSDLMAYGSTAVIPSISLGAERTLLFRKCSDPSAEFEVRMASGSLVLMGNRFQDDYEHCVPVEPDCLSPRINLTFRQFDWPKGCQRARRVG